MLTAMSVGRRGPAAGPGRTRTRTRAGRRSCDGARLIRAETTNLSRAKMATPDLVTELQLERSLRKQAERERDNARVERDNERKKAEKMVEKFEQERSRRIKAEKLAREMMVKNGAEFASFIGKKNNVFPNCFKS